MKRKVKRVVAEEKKGTQKAEVLEKKNSKALQ